MAIRNFTLLEAADNTFNPGPYISAFKKAMNTCKLTKFRSSDSNSFFYSSFFLSQTQEPLTFDQWRQIYTALLNDDGFCNNLVLYIGLYQPKSYEGLFRTLINLIDSELNQMNTNQIRYLSEAKSFLTFLQMKFDSIGTTIKAQTNNFGAMNFLVMINQVLQSNIFYLNDLIQRQSIQNYDKDEITYEIHGPLEEDVREILYLFEHAEEWMNNYAKTHPEPMNEGIINAAKEKAKQAFVMKEKVTRAFDEFVMRKVKEARAKRRNRKHAELVGEALRINHEIARLMKSGLIFIVSPVWSAIYWVISVVIDRQTDAKDRKVLVDQLKDEIEICDEKISMAERNGDDKGKIELMRLKQKLTHEYERINRTRYTGN